MWSNDIECKCMFMFHLYNLARRELTSCCRQNPHWVPDPHSLANDLSRLQPIDQGPANTQFRPSYLISRTFRGFTMTFPSYLEVLTTVLNLSWLIATQFFWRNIAIIGKRWKSKFWKAEISIYQKKYKTKHSNTFILIRGRLHFRLNGGYGE